MTTAVAEPLTPAAQAILDALAEAGPMTRPALAEATGQAIGPLGTRLAVLAEANLVRIGAELVGLPHQSLEDWRPDEAAEYKRRQELWRRQGLLMLTLGEIDDAYLAQQLRLLAIRLYGHRRCAR